MKKVLVLGIGNRLMKDDGIGLYVVEALQKHHVDERVRYIIGETDIDYCLNVIEDANVLIIVDAVDTGKNPGEVTLFPLHKFITLELGISAHNLHLFHMIPIVYPDIFGFVIGIDVGKIDFGMDLSEELNKRFNYIVESVFKNIYSFVYGN